LAEQACSFSGWDFSHLDGRMTTEPLPWDYRSIVDERLKPSDRLLDMGTGGGEFLLTLGHPPELTTVTEAWPPNLKLCQQRLAPLGINVVHTFNDDALPLGDASFDVVLNRHESFDAREVFRVVRPGGVFVTQQVGGRNNADLASSLIDGWSPSFPNHSLAVNKQLLTDAGFIVIADQEASPVTRFTDVGAVVYYAKIIEWEFAGFNVDTCFTKLLKLNKHVQDGQPITATGHRFLLVATRPTS